MLPDLLLHLSEASLFQKQQMCYPLLGVQICIQARSKDLGSRTSARCDQRGSRDTASAQSWFCNSLHDSGTATLYKPNALTTHTP